MRQYALIGALVLAGETARAAPVALSEDELKAAVVGKTVKIDTPLGMPLTVQIAANGLMHGTASAPLALYLGAAKDRGRWRVKDGKLCQKWFKWLDAEESCLTIKLDGQKVYWRKDDGRTGTAMIEPGPPVLAGSSASGLGLPPNPDAEPKVAAAHAPKPAPAPRPIAAPRAVAAVHVLPRPAPDAPPSTAIAETVAGESEPHLVEPPRVLKRHAADTGRLAMLASYAPAGGPPPPPAEAPSGPASSDPFDAEAQPMRWAADLAAIATLEHRWCLPDAFGRGPAPPRGDVGLPQGTAFELDATPTLAAVLFEQSYPGELPLHEAACLTAAPALLLVPTRVD